MAFSLYVHYPFCQNKCSYCDFYKELYSTSLEERFYQALTIETGLAAERYGSNCDEVSSIFVGGGTPSLTNLDYFGKWLGYLKKLFRVPDGAEFSIETNPESVSRENLSALKHLGVNRPVFGVQSFNPGLLRFLGRRHIPHHSQRAIYLANALGFGNFSVDLVFGLPQQTSRILSADIDQIIDLDPPHISFYRLTLEENASLAMRVASGELRLPDQELVLAMYRGACEQFAEAGYVRYELSSFAKPGYECRHSLGFWQGNDYLGLGPSACSSVNGHRFANKASLTGYIEILESGKLPMAADESRMEPTVSDAVVRGLGMTRGMSRGQFSRRSGVPFEERPGRKRYDTPIESGHLVPDAD